MTMWLSQCAKYIFPSWDALVFILSIVLFFSLYFFPDSKCIVPVHLQQLDVQKLSKAEDLQKKKVVFFSIKLDHKFRNLNWVW